MGEFSRPVEEPQLNDLELRSGGHGFFSNFLLGVIDWVSSSEGNSEKVLVSRMEELEEAFQDFENDIKDIVESDSYISSQDLEVLEFKSEKVFELLDSLDSESFKVSIDDYLVERFEEIKYRFEEDLNLLEGYNEVFVEHELERFDYLFEKGEYSLNEEQRKAVVRNDDFNRVVAGAGAGKTLVLIYRIAYLVEKGVDPEDILALTLTRKACEEVQQRLKNVFGIEGVEVRTFHSMGYKILDIGSGVKISTVDGKDREHFIEDELRELNPESELSSHIRDFLYFRDSEMVSREDFQSREDFIEARAESRYKTLKGEEVKSEAEKFIADFLFTHGINYRYEAMADWAETGDGYTDYSPDFYLSEYDIYIEHWGIDGDEEVPDWFSWSTERYKEKMKWARQLFEQNERDLIETFESEYRSDGFEKLLLNRLRSRKKVELELKTAEELAESLGEEDVIKKLAKSFSKFIETAKTFDVDFREIKDQLDSIRDRKNYYFGSAGLLLMERYEKWLGERIDYQDMVHEANDKIRSEPEKFGKMYDHVLVDEFQDVAYGQIQLIDLLAGKDEANLFCVGDDWQSIYGFRGAVVDFFIEFEEFFGEATTTTKLVKNYRSTPPIVQAGNQLIDQNRKQLKKELTPIREGSQKPYVHIIENYSEKTYRYNTAGKTLELVERYLNSGSDPQNIMILAREEKSPLTDVVRSKLRDKNILVGEEGGVKVLTAHQAKGREAKHVVILNVSKGHRGFSPEIKESQLVNIPRNLDIDTEAEERRLFYVAMTRAEDTLDIMTKKGQTSIFLEDIRDKIKVIRSLADPGAEKELIEIVAKVDRLWKAENEKINQVGVLRDSTGSTKFVAWSSTVPPELHKGEKYRFKQLMVVKNDNEKELHFRPQTEVEKLD